jgi:hypothetical protein
MPLCPQITNTPITVTQTADFTVTSVVPAVADTKDGLAFNLGEVIESSGNQVYRQLTPPTSPPFTLKIGDLWFDTDDGNKEYYWDGTNWISVQDGSIATKNRTYYSGTAPTGSDLVTGDIWFDTSTGNKPYRWSGSAWISVQDASIATALSDANAAQTTADGKNKVIYSLSTPSGSGTAIGDIWFQYNGSGIIVGQWEWTGSVWSSKTIGSAVIANLDAGKITAGTISAAISLEAATITGGSININSGTFVVTSGGAVTITATNGININSGTFQVSNTGAVTASNLTINGGSISLNGGVFSVSTTGVLTASAGTVGGWTLDGSGYLRNSGFTTFLYPSTSPGGNASTYAIYSDRGFLGSVLQVQSSSTTALYAPSGGLNVGLGITAASSAFVVSSTGNVTSVGNITSTGSLSTGSASFVVSSGGAITTVGNITSTGTISTSGSITATNDVTANRDLFTPNHTTVTDAANGRVTITLGRVTRSTASSQRYKENITPVRDINELDPKRLLDLPVRAFTYREDYLSESDSRFGALIPGFIAEEVDAVYPVAADYENGEVESWNDRMIVPGLLALIQDLYKEVQILKGE